MRRPNRYLAYIKLPSGEVVKAHVPDPGRLKELLVSNAEVLVRKHSFNKKSQRKTAYSLIGVRTGNVWVNIESQLANKLFARDFSKFKTLEQYNILRAEFQWHSSRFDFLLQHKKTGKHALVEIKSVTLVEDSVALFPDAPTSRGARHVKELIESLDFGYNAFLVFVVKRADAKSVSVNDKRDPVFSHITREAIVKGVKVIALKYNYEVIKCPKLMFLGDLPFKC